MGDGKLLNWLKGVADPATIITDTVVGSVKGVADVVEKFVETPEKKSEMQKALMDYELEIRKEAGQLDRAVFADRASARQMAGVHGPLQSKFAITFLRGFWIFLILDIILIAGFAIFGARLDIPQWIQLLISNTITGVIAYLVSIIKEITGFLFGGSAGTDQASSAMMETLRAKTASDQ